MITNYLKPKSESEYIDVIKRLSPDEQAQIGLNKRLERIVLLGLTNGADPNYVLTQCIEYKFYNAIRYIASTRCIACNTGIKLAIKFDDDGTIVKIFLANGYKPSDENLTIAVAKNNFNAVKTLLNNSDLDPALHKNILLSIALFNKNKPIIDLITNDPRVKASLSKEQMLQYKNKPILKESLVK
jgi:hypothetical protein